MKKLLSVILLAAFLFPLPSAAEGRSSTLIEILDELDYDTIVYVKQKVDARYEELKAQKETEENTKLFEWEQKFYVDMFGDPTDDAYIRNKKYIAGTFSNSATTNSLLEVRLLISKHVEMFLYEYGKYQLKTGSEEYYTIYVKDGTGERTRLTGVLSNDRMMLYNKEMDETFINMLCTPQIISVYLQSQSSYSTATYLFTVNTAGFAEVYRQAFGE